MDALFRAIQRDVRYNTNIATTAAVAEWTLKAATVETTMPEGVLVAADPKMLHKAYLATLPPDLRAYVENLKNKPNDQPAEWETVAKLLRSIVEAPFLCPEENAVFDVGKGVEVVTVSDWAVRGVGHWHGSKLYASAINARGTD